MNRYGEGCSVNYQKAFQFYVQSAEQNDVQAQINLGMIK